MPYPTANNYLTNAFPPGVITPYAGSSAPLGYLLCDGSAVSRATYPSLFGVIGTTYGVGDGSTTFNLPDMKGRVAVGKSTDTEFDALGETGGAKTVTLTSPKLNENVALTSTSTELNLLNGKLGVWTTSTPVVTASSGTFTTISCAMRHTQIGKIVFIEFSIAITTNETAAGSTIVPLPVNCAAVTVLPGRETAAVGKMLQGYVGATSITVLGYDNNYVGGNGYTLVMGGSYEAA